MLLLITITFLLKRYGTQAIPLLSPSPESASLGAAPIFARDNPSDGCHSRTVLDILWSCLATTFACTWVSVHPNVPFKGEGKWMLLRRRIFLMFFSILAPEFMIMWAFKQWRGAVMIREAVNSAFPGSDKPWTTTHGHFLQMGGFQLHTTARENMFAKKSTALHRRSHLSLIPDHFVYQPDDHDAITQKIRKQLHEITERHCPEEVSEEDAARVNFGDDVFQGVLTFDALKNLLAENLITLPTITDDEINDKSKGDALSKGIALLQLTWFIVQIITRAVQGLAITELELTTVALAGLNSVMYVFWWSKPRDVRFSMVIRTKGVEALQAKRIDSVTWSFTDSKSGFDFREHLWSSLRTSITGVFNSLSTFIVSLLARIVRATLELVGALSVVPHYLYSHFSNGFQYFLIKIGNLKGHKSSRDTNKEDDGPPEVVIQTIPEGTSLHRSCMKKLYTALICGSKTAGYCFAFLWSLPAYVINYGLGIPISRILGSAFWDNREEILPMVFDADEQARVFSMMFYSEAADFKPLLTTSSITGALFGAVHCLAWHFSFPSHVEQILWRTASLGIVGSCAVTFQTVLYWDFAEGLEGSWEVVGALLIFLGLLLGGLASLIYPVARITLLVLAITSLRSLPSSAFDTVDWIEFVPHI